jgi:hypothetical protein
MRAYCTDCSHTFKVNGLFAAGVLALSLLTAPPASAGQSPGSGAARSVIVTEFTNRSKSALSGPELVRMVTDAVAVELAGSNRFEVLRRQEVERAASALGYRAPYDRVELSKISTSLGASDVVAGEIAAVQMVRPKGKPRTVRVGLRVRVLDAAREDTVNGAAVVGFYTARDASQSDDEMAREAATRAAYEAVRQIVSTTLPEGIILNTVGGGSSGLKILLNRGHRDGVQEGMEMAVYRGTERLGVVRVTSVMSRYAEAEPVEYSLGYRPLDTIRAIFPMPELDMR